MVFICFIAKVTTWQSKEQGRVRGTNASYNFTRLESSSLQAVSYFPNAPINEEKLNPLLAPRSARHVPENMPRYYPRAMPLACVLGLPNLPGLPSPLSACLSARLPAKPACLTCLTFLTALAWLACPCLPTVCLACLPLRSLGPCRRNG